MSGLPKQWRHWLKKAKLKTGSRSKHYNYYFTDKNMRHFRVNNLDMLQICDGDMERWANSVGCEIPLPTNERDFLLGIQYLYDNSCK